MNLVNMAQRQDENLVLSDSAMLSKRRETLSGEALTKAKETPTKGTPTEDMLAEKAPIVTYRGFRLESSSEPAIVIKHALKWYPFCSHTKETGWAIRALPKDGRFADSQLEVSLRDDDDSVLAAHRIAVKEEPTPVTLPELSDFPKDTENCHLALRLVKPRLNFLSLIVRTYITRTLSRTYSQEPDIAFLSIHKAMNREDVLSLCKGKGIELGPGPKPQVLPGAEVEVTYIEQTPPQEWEELYNDKGSYDVEAKLWDNYQIGEACNLPVEQHSLDFIFSSHVFEHLANPIGHLKYWETKLQKGGKVIGIVPDVAGCKDYVHRPSPMSEMLDELASGDMEPTLAHYDRWAKHHRPNEDPKKYYEAKRSIHVHYYTKHNMEELLQYAVDCAGYSAFKLQYTPNHKDFYFVLSK